MNTNKKQTTIIKPYKAPVYAAVIKRDNVINSIAVTSNGQQKPITRGRTAAKFVDTVITFNIPNVGGVLAGLNNIPQGVGVSNRTGDTVFMRSLHINYDITTQNPDIFNTSRIIIFQWHENSNLVAPTVGQILQNAGLYAMYDWQNSPNYTILYDKVHFQSGTATNPDSSGNQGYFGVIPFKKGFSVSSQFNPAAVTGTNQLYILAISDSLIAPFPILNITARIIYSDD